MIKQLLFGLSFLAVAAPSSLLLANINGADPRLTGAPGDDTCRSCHAGTALNASGGSVQIKMPGPNTYTPGVKQHVSVIVADSATTQKRWGFELSARLNSDLRNGQAGGLASTDGNAQVNCDNGRRAPCSAPTVVQFVTHTTNGTRNGTTGPVAFEFDWTPPATDLGKITLYAAGNAANGNGNNSGDHIYTTSLELTPAVSAPKPSISSDKGILSAASQLLAAAPNTWLTISGTNFATTTRTWTADEIATNTLPIALDNVSVTVNGKPAFIQYVSPERINLLTPVDDSVGDVPVVVTSNGVASDASMVTLVAMAPALFTLDGKYLATTAGDNTNFTKSNTFLAGIDRKATVAPGGRVTLYGTGFGPTDPPVDNGAIPQADAPLVTLPTVTIGGMPATLVSGALGATLPRVYVFNVQVPDGLPDGDQAVVMQVGGVSTPADCCVISVQKQ